MNVEYVYICLYGITTYMQDEEYSIQEGRKLESDSQVNISVMKIEDVSQWSVLQKNRSELLSHHSERLPGSFSSFVGTGSPEVTVKSSMGSIGLS